MNTRPSSLRLPAGLAAAALALAMSAGAQAPPAPSPATTSPQAAPMTMSRHHKARATRVGHGADMKAECQAMMAKKQEMHDKLQAMDASLDKLVAEMNAAKGSREPDAMEKAMAAVINELVAQRKASRPMMTEMQHGSMAHMAHHARMHGTKGTMECPMMKTGHAPEPKAEETKPRM